MIYKDVEHYKRNQLWYVIQCKLQWMGFYKQNNKFGNYNKTIGKLDEELSILRNKAYPSRIV